MEFASHCELRPNSVNNCNEQEYPLKMRMNFFPEKLRNIFQILLSIFLIFGSSSALEARPKKTHLMTYVVQRGDSCWSIAQMLYGNPRKYTLIHKYNDLGKEPHILKVGQKLRVPIFGEPAAHLLWLRNEVKAKPPYSIDWQRARLKMNLWKLYRLATEKNSAARLQFRDRSHLRMREDALLIIYDGSARGSRLRRKLKTNVVVKKGIVKGGLASLYKSAGLKIKTPAGTIHLRSKDSQIEVDAKKRSIISVYQGEADVAAQGKKVNVKENFGTYVDKGRPPEKPRPLPPAPRWYGFKKKMLIFALGVNRVAFQVRWHSVKRAVRYRLELSYSRNFGTTILDKVIRPHRGQKIISFTVPKRRLGRYYARVSAIDSVKLESRPSSLLEIEILKGHASRKLKPSKDGSYKVVGLLKVDSPRSIRAEVAKDEEPFHPFTEAIFFYKPGIHRLRIRPQGEKSAFSIKVKVLQIRAKIVQHKKDKSLFFLTLRDELGAPAVVPGLKLMVYPLGNVLKLIPRRAGLFEAKLPKTLQAPKVVLVASWLMGELARKTFLFNVKRPAPKLVKVIRYIKKKKRIRKIESFRWPHLAHSAINWPNPRQLLSLRGTHPVTFIGLDTSLSEGTHLEKQRPLYIKFALQTTLALLDGHLGLDLSLPWLQFDAQFQRSNRSKLGDIKLGFRYLLFENSSWQITPYFQISLPTGAYERRFRQWLLAGGLLAQWQLFNWLFLGGNLAVLGASDFQQAHAFSLLFTLGAEVRLTSSWALALDLHLGADFAGEKESSKAFNQGISLALRFYFDRLRLSLIGGIAPTSWEGMTSLFGAYSVGLRFDLGF